MRDDITSITLPSSSKMRHNFLFGVATASFQIEGDRHGRLPCIWDTFCEKDGAIADGSDGDVACEHILRWRDDVALMSDLGVDAYRFSVSWPRLMTKDGTLNPDGLAFYLDLLDALNQRGIKPFVTLYHWDLPQHLEDRGGWLNRDTAYAFKHYADVVSRAFKGRVHSFATFNEPFCSAYLGYEAGVHAPGKTGRKNGRQAAHHILLAHGLAMQVLNQTSPDTLNGIVLNFTPCYPATDSDDDKLAAEKASQYINWWYIHPLFEKSYPAIFDELPDADRPAIEPGDFDIIAQPLDFLGVNYYTRLTYSAPRNNNSFYHEHAHNAPTTDIGWEICPDAFTRLLTDLNQRYPLPPLYITENGAAFNDTTENGEVDDQQRIAYFNSHLNALHNAMEQGVDVRGYFAWSLMDNFEWAEGYLKRFGLVYVDYTTQQRTVKASGRAYQRLLASR